MSSNILITGSAGYLGGSIIADFLSNNSAELKGSHIIAAVRSDEQAKILSDAGINVLQLDLKDENAVKESLVKHEINIVIHTASSLDLSLALNLLAGLDAHQKASGKKAYFIHTAGLSAFCLETGWPEGTMKDSGSIFETEKQVADSFPIRKNDVAITETAEALGITSYIVVPSTIYGKGTGKWNQLSVIFPIAVQASIKQRTVSKFPRDSNFAGVHISDLTELYGLIIKKILQGSGETIPNGTRGYYFAIADKMAWWNTLDHLAAAMKARGLVDSSETQLWSSNKAATEATGVPEVFVELFFNSTANIVVDNAFKLGWKPTWDKARFLENIDDEVVSVLELGKAKSSLIDSLHQAANN